jgi:hypothetical protein
VSANNVLQRFLVAIQLFHYEDELAFFINPDKFYIPCKENIKEVDGVYFLVRMFDGMKIDIIFFVLYFSIVRENVEKIDNINAMFFNRIRTQPFWLV